MQFCDILAAANGNLFAESIWQIGALDGRVRMLEQWKPKLNAGSKELMRRVKHQLDPVNIFPDIPITDESHEDTSHV